MEHERKRARKGMGKKKEERGNEGQGHIYLNSCYLNKCRRRTPSLSLSVLYIYSCLFTSLLPLSLNLFFSHSFLSLTLSLNSPPLSFSTSTFCLFFLYVYDTITKTVEKSTQGQFQDHRYHNLKSDCLRFCFCFECHTVFGLALPKNPGPATINDMEQEYLITEQHRKETKLVLIIIRSAR